ncbi:Alpha/beta fold hydrolase [Planctomycetales bacterium 10988]|nr:Alpha/beta fold hydrolase [Planctomycetales bacterium 10988]
MSKSILDDPAISGRYLFPQSRYIEDPFEVEVGGATLKCHRQIIDSDRPTLIHFHGNGEAVYDYVPDLATVFEEMGLNTIFVEYRKYGGSTGEAHLVEMLGDGEAVLKAAGVNPEKTVAFGRSIGSLYAIELVHRIPSIAGLILESGIADPAERFLLYADLETAGVSESEVQAESKKYFDHQAKLAAYKNPLLLLHTEFDGLVEIVHAERNLAWAGSDQKELVRFPAGNHNSILSVNFEAYLAAVKTFIFETVRKRSL